MRARYRTRLQVITLGLFVLTAMPAANAATPWNAHAARQALSQGHADRALSAARARLKQAPRDPQALFLEGMALADKGQVAKAVTVFEQLSRRFPKRSRVWNNLGVLYARQGHLDKARHALQHALAQAPHGSRAAENLGDVYLALADATYARAEHDPGDHAGVVHKRQSLQRILPALARTARAAGHADQPGSRHEQGAGTRPAKAQASGADHAGDASQAASGADLHGAIARVLSRWARAQSHHDASAYLAVYSNNYQPAGDADLADWIRRQRQRVRNASSVQIAVHNLSVQRAGANRVKASFQEVRRTDEATHRHRRQMVFVREDDHWRIQRAT